MSRLRSIIDERDVEWWKWDEGPAFTEREHAVDWGKCVLRMETLKQLAEAQAAYAHSERELERLGEIRDARLAAALDNTKAVLPDDQSSEGGS